MEKILTFDEINILAKKIGNLVKKNLVVALIGNLGTGKTTFVKTIAKEIGVTENLKSPTFNYVLEYFSGKYPIYHFDVYRISDPMEIYEIGYEDYLNKDGLIIIEWADLIESELPKEYVKIEFEYNSINNRKVKLSYVGNEVKNKELLKYANFGD